MSKSELAHLTDRGTGVGYTEKQKDGHKQKHRDRDRARPKIKAFKAVLSLSLSLLSVKCCRGYSEDLSCLTSAHHDCGTQTYLISQSENRRRPKIKKGGGRDGILECVSVSALCWAGAAGTVPLNTLAL